MGVVYHGYRWRTAASDLDAIRRITMLATVADADALSGEARRLLARRLPRSTLAAFGLADTAYLDRWLTPEHAHPALVALLSIVPRLRPLDPSETTALVRTRGQLVRAGGAGERPSDPPFAAFLAQQFGPTPLDARPLPGELGRWSQPEDDCWLVSTAIW